MKRQRIDEGEEVAWYLPLPIIQHILSYLSTKDAARTSLASKNVYSAWSTKPILNLDFDEIDEEQNKKPNNPRNNQPVIADHESEDSDEGSADESDEESADDSDDVSEDDSDDDSDKESEVLMNCAKGTREEFVNFAVKKLQRYHNHKVCIQHLHLSMRCFPRQDSTYFTTELFDNIEKAGSLIKEIHFSYTLRGLEYSLPNDLFGILKFKALRELNVNGFCSLELKFVPRELNCCLLRKLVLKDARMVNATLESLISSCPLIETLKLIKCKGLYRINVVNLDRLKECVIRMCKSKNSEIVVKGPSLESLDCKNTQRPSEFKLHYPCQNLKELKLCHLPIEDSFFQNLADKFPNLEDLSVEDCTGIERINISSNSIKSLCMNFREAGQIETNISAPGLASFEYDGNSVPCFNSSVIACKCDIRINLEEGDLFDASGFVRLKNTLSQFIESTVSLDLTFEGLDFVENLSCSLIFRDHEPAAQVENLCLEIDEELETCSSSFSALVDNLFWCCKPKTISIYWSAVTNTQFFEYFCSRLMDRRNRDNGKSGEYKYSWENDLKEVDIQTFYGYGKEGQPLHVDWRTLVNTPCYLSKLKTSIFTLKWQKELQPIGRQ